MNKIPVAQTVEQLLQKNRLSKAKGCEFKSHQKFMLYFWSMPFTDGLSNYDKRQLKLKNTNEKIKYNLTVEKAKWCKYLFFSFLSALL